MPSVLLLEHPCSLDITRARTLLVLIKHAPSVQLLEHPCSLDISGARALVIIPEHAPPGIYKARTLLRLFWISRLPRVYEARALFASFGPHALLTIKHVRCSLQKYMQLSFVFWQRGAKTRLVFILH